MKWDPSVSWVCVDGAGDKDDSGEEGKLFTASHTAKERRVQVTEAIIKISLKKHHFQATANTRNQ